MTLTTAGMENVAGLIIGGAASAGWVHFDALSVGTHGTVPTASDTSMGGTDASYGAQIADADTVAVDFSSAPSCKWVETFSFTSADKGGSIAECGIWNLLSGGTMLSHVTFSHTSVTVSDTLALTYYLEVQQG
jgi:hypothetical protein